MKANRTNIQWRTLEAKSHYLLRTNCRRVSNSEDENYKKHFSKYHGESEGYPSLTTITD